jgi:hypothetical protein
LRGNCSPRRDATSSTRAHSPTRASSSKVAHAGRTPRTPAAREKTTAPRHKTIHMGLGIGFNRVRFGRFIRASWFPSTGPLFTDPAIRSSVVTRNSALAFQRFRHRGRFA